MTMEMSIRQFCRAKTVTTLSINFLCEFLISHLQNGNYGLKINADTISQPFVSKRKIV